jgi:hypothetical protein
MEVTLIAPAKGRRVSVIELMNDTEEMEKSLFDSATLDILERPFGEVLSTLRSRWFERYRSESAAQKVESPSDSKATKVEELGDSAESAQTD